jgi:hypothetical protein
VSSQLGAHRKPKRVGRLTIQAGGSDPPVVDVIANLRSRRAILLWAGAASGFDRVGCCRPVSARRAGRGLFRRKPTLASTCRLSFANSLAGFGLGPQKTWRQCLLSTQIMRATARSDPIAMRIRWSGCNAQCLLRQLGSGAAIDCTTTWADPVAYAM